MKNNLKEYLFECFDFLNLKYKIISENNFEVTYNENLMLFTFDENNKDDKFSFLNKDSSFVKNIAKAVTLKGTPIPYTILEFKIENIEDRLLKKFSNETKFKISKTKRIKEECYIFWAKFSLKGFKNDEIINIYKYNIQDNSINKLNLSNEELFNKLISKEKNSRIKNKEELEKNILSNIKNTASSFLEEKNKEASSNLKNEIDRINNYYDLLENEDSSGETSSTYANKNERTESLLKERKSLIEQQKIKYNFTEENLSIKIVEYIKSDILIEEIDIELENKSKTKKIITIRGDKEFDFENNEEKTVNLLSNGTLVVGKEVSTCSNCKDINEKSNTKLCSICDKNLCRNCTNRSVISHAVLCNEHKEKCSNCKEIVSVEEIDKCRSCGITYCKWCLPGGCCSLCNDLY